MGKLCYGCMKPKNEKPVCEHCGYDERSLNPQDRLQVGTLLRNRYLVGKVADRNKGKRAYVGMDLETMEVCTIQEHLYNYVFSYTEISREIQQLFLRDIYYMNSMQDISEIYGPKEYFEYNGNGYVISEYLEYTTLTDWLSNNQKSHSVSEILMVLRPVMEALEEVHQRGMFHGQIEPDVILIDQDNRVRLTGFEIYDQQGLEGFRAKCVPIDPPFEAPELRYGEVGPWTDVYGICAVIYYCLTGRSPICEWETREVSLYSVSGLDSQQLNALHRGMEFWPKNRTQSMQQLMDDLFGVPFVRVDPNPKPDDFPLGGVPVRPRLTGAMVYEPEGDTKGLKKWFSKWRK